MIKHTNSAKIQLMIPNQVWLTRPHMVSTTVNIIFWWQPINLRQCVICFVHWRDNTWRDLYLADRHTHTSDNGWSCELISLSRPLLVINKSMDRCRLYDGWTRDEYEPGHLLAIPPNTLLQYSLSPHSPTWWETIPLFYTSKAGNIPH